MEGGSWGLAKDNRDILKGDIEFYLKILCRFIDNSYETIFTG